MKPILFFSPVGFEPIARRSLQGGLERYQREPHKLVKVGSTPTPATISALPRFFEHRRNAWLASVLTGQLPLLQTPRRFSSPSLSRVVKYFPPALAHRFFLSRRAAS